MYKKNLVQCTVFSLFAPSTQSSLQVAVYCLNLFTCWIRINILHVDLDQEDLPYCADPRPANFIFKYSSLFTFMRVHTVVKCPLLVMVKPNLVSFPKSNGY